MKEDRQKTPRELSEEKRDDERFGQDPNSIDRLKMFGLHEKDGKFYEQIGDEFFEVEIKNNEVKNEKQRFNYKNI